MDMFLVKKLNSEDLNRKIKKILKVKKSSECFTKKNSLELKKVIKKKGNKLHVKWKGYNSSYNSWIDKKRHNINE